jgi:phage-related minor tail protein
MKAQAIALINMGLKAMGFGGLSLPGKAAGGPVSGGTPYIVGERGPELFVPSGSGAIVPNHRLADSMGGGQSQVVYNGPYIASMSAIDTQSAMQFLAKNKQGVWAANQSAQRSMPVSR